MSCALNIATRKQIIDLKLSGHSVKEISRELSQSYSTIYGIVKRYESGGVEGLAASYANCGIKGLRTSEQIYKQALSLKELHPLWGAPRIHLALQEAFPEVSIPQIRTLQRWFKEKGLTKPRTRYAEASIGESTAVHNIWQVDAKEQLTLCSEKKACYLSFTDEKSGAFLEARVFPL